MSARALNRSLCAASAEISCVKRSSVPCAPKKEKNTAAFDAAGAVPVVASPAHKKARGEGHDGRTMTTLPLLFVLLLLATGSVCPGEALKDVFTNHFLVKFRSEDPQVVQQVAERLGFRNLGPVSIWKKNYIYIEDDESKAFVHMFILCGYLIYTLHTSFHTGLSFLSLLVAKNFFAGRKRCSYCFPVRISTCFNHYAHICLIRSESEKSEQYRKTNQCHSLNGLPHFLLPQVLFLYDSLNLL